MEKQDNHDHEPHLPSEDSLRPEPALELVQNREFISENVSISGRHFLRCSFNFCNLIYSGGPVGVVECGGGHNRLVEIGPLLEALKDVPAGAIKDKMIRYWKEVRVGFNLEVIDENNSITDAQSSSETEV
jgi:hypothetical protein